MDIHRCRFVNYPTSAINALAFSHASAHDFAHDHISSLRLAVGRSNGDVEIWSSRQKNWFQESVFHGGRNRSIEGLVWTQDPEEEEEDGQVTAGRLRLFSIGYSSTVTEWSLETGLPARNWAGNNSEIWCMAAQPRMRAEKGNPIPLAYQKIVVGCADGSLILLSTENGDLQFSKYLTRAISKRARVLSLAFHNQDTLVTGYADSTIRIYDIEQGNLKRSISLGSGPKDGPRDILVWAVKCLENGSIVSGDSIGEVRVFESKQYSQTQRIASHDADILSLAIRKSTGTIFSAGMDRKTTVYDKRKNKDQWNKSSQASHHEHDVKAMAAFEGNGLNIIASGGLDTNLVILPMQSYGKEYQLTISGLPQHPSIDSAPNAGLFACWWQQEVHLWKFEKFHRERRQRQVARLTLKGEESISNASLSADGRYLAVVTAAELKIFTISSDFQNGEESVKVGRIRLETKETGRLIKFSEDGKWVAIVSQTNTVKIASFVAEEEGVTRLDFRLLRRIDREVQHKSLGGYTRTINRVCFSPDSKTLAVSDLDGYLDSWFLLTSELSATEINGTAKTNGHLTDPDSDSDSSDNDDQEAMFGDYIWKQSSLQLPTLESPVLVLSFRPTPVSSAQEPPRKGTMNKSKRTEPRVPSAHIFVVTATHHIREFDLGTGALTSWSNRNPKSVLPEKFQSLRDRAMGMIWDTAGWTWLYGSQWVFGLDTTVDHKIREDERVDQRGKKRKRGAHGAGGEKRGADQSVMVEVDEDAGGQAAPDEDAMDLDSDAEAAADALVEKLRDGNASMTNGMHKEQEERPKSFIAYKYRPILGMVPIKRVEGKGEEGALEVALVERPLWDLDLPSRFENIHAR